VWRSTAKAGASVLGVIHPVRDSSLDESGLYCNLELNSHYSILFPTFLLSALINFSG